MKISYKLLLLIVFNFLNSIGYSQDISVMSFNKLESIVDKATVASNINASTQIAWISTKQNSSNILMIKDKNLISIKNNKYFTLGRNLVGLKNSVLMAATSYNNLNQCYLLSIINLIISEPYSKDNCISEVFYTDDERIYYWYYSFSEKKHYISKYIDKNSNFINIDLSGELVTSIIDINSNLYIAHQVISNVKEFRIEKYATSKIVEGIKISGVGGRLIKHPNGLMLSFNRDGNPYLALYDINLKLMWETKVVDSIGLGSVPNVFYIGNLTIFLAGNNGKLFVAIVNDKGQVVSRAMDQSPHSSSSDGYSIKFSNRIIYATGISRLYSDMTNENQDQYLEYKILLN